jgi:hypothetical protein
LTTLPQVSNGRLLLALLLSASVTSVGDATVKV